MFADLPLPSLAFDLPWNQTLEQRRHAVLSGKRRVAWLYQNPDSSTFRYRVFNMVESLTLDEEKRLAATWFCGDELDAIHDLVPKLETLVLGRFQFGAALERLLSLAQRSGVRILFDCDDLVFDVRYAPLVMRSLAQDIEAHHVWDGWYSYMGRLRSAAAYAEAGITTNRFLADRMTSALNGMPVTVVPNFLNRDQQSYSSRLLQAKREAGWLRKGRIKIGYFSGSPTHRNDFAVAAPALARLLDRHDDVEVRVVGYLDHTGALARHRDRVEILPHMNYIELQKAIAEVEINIAPLQDNTFTNCKSELKFFEAAVVGTWTLASPTYTFAQSIKSGVTGELVRAHEWDDSLAAAVELARSATRYGEHAERAAQYAYERYGWDRFTDQIIDAVSKSRAGETND